MAIDPFFASTRKRKRNNNKSVQKKQPVRPKNTQNNQDSDIEGDSDDVDHFNTNASAESSVESSDEEIEETAAEKRVRLAKAYLESIERNAEGIIFYERRPAKMHMLI
jgi:ribosomal RNA-processing protein 9